MASTRLLRTTTSRAWPVEVTRTVIFSSFIEGPRSRVGLLADLPPRSGASQPSALDRRLRRLQHLPLDLAQHLPDLEHRPVDRALLDVERWRDPYHGAVRVLGQHAVLEHLQHDGTRIGEARIDVDADEQ